VVAWYTHRMMSFVMVLLVMVLVCFVNLFFFTVLFAFTTTPLQLLKIHHHTSTIEAPQSKEIKEKMTTRDPLPLPSTLLLPDKKGLARHQLNLPIVRSPISLQTSKLPNVNNGCSSISPTYLSHNPKVNSVDTATINSPVMSKDNNTNNSSSSSGSNCTDTEQGESRTLCRWFVSALRRPA